jgi:hypothetical protein
MTLMTQYIYIASPVKLRKGSFGSRPLSPEQPNVFKDELDFTGLYFENNYDSKSKRRFSYSPHFTFEHQVATESRPIPLKHQLKGTAKEEKCLNILYFYLEEALQTSGVLELSTCISGKEGSPISEQRSIRWSDIKTPYDLVQEDREFWSITL